MQTTEIRLIGSIVGLLPFLRKEMIHSVRNLPLENKFSLLYATFLGTNIGILLQQTVFKILPIGLGWTILSISPVISLIFSKAEGEKITWKNICFAMTTFSGVAIALI